MVSIIILSYNTKALLKTCLDSIYKNIKSIEFEVIVVDNASKDESCKMVKSEFPKVILIENKINLGFSKGINIGAKKAKGTYLLFLNSDTEILKDKFRDMLSIFDKDKKIGIAGGSLVNQDGSKQRSFGKFYNLLNIINLLIFGERFNFAKKGLNSIKYVDWVSGGFMLVDKNIFQNISGFDEQIFMYMEDVELCYRVKKLGYKVLFYPDAEALHVNQGSSNRSFAIVEIYKGILYFYKKHKNSVQYNIVKTLLVTKALIAIAIGFLTSNSYLSSTYRKALNV